METITIKLDEKFAKDVERAMKKYQYTKKSEFVKKAIIDKLNLLKTQDSIKRLYGTSKRKTSDKQLHKAREQAFDTVA